MKSKRNIIISLLIVLLLSFSFFYQDQNTDAKKTNNIVKTEEKVKNDHDLKSSKVELKANKEIIDKNEEEDLNKEELEKDAETPSDQEVVSKKPLNPNASSKDPVSSEKNNTTEPTAKKPVPQTEKVEEKDPVSYASIFVRANTVLNNLDKLDKSKHNLIPSDGLIYGKNNVKIEAGDTAFDLLHKELKSAKIHLDFNGNPLYDSVYIKGINNLYEFDCGQLSGWMYKVNGQFLGYGASNAILKDNDVVEFVYTCDMGADVGNSF